MSLITRCPACGTMFKVVTDQLKVSQGWVRCGHCAEVFDASAHLLPRESTGLAPLVLTPPGDASGASPSPPVPVTTPEQVEEPDPAPQAEEWAPARALAYRVPLRPSVETQEENWEASGAPDSDDGFDPAHWRQEQHERQYPSIPAALAAQAPFAVGDSLSHRTDMPSMAGMEASGFEASSGGDFGSPDAQAAQDVSFVRDARRKAFWKQPAVRASLAALALLLFTALGLQWVMQQKDSLAVLEPRFAPWLQSLCAPLGCEIRPPRHIESLVIDSSSFHRIGPDAYRLSFTLKNTGATPLEMPSLEVTLTDGQDQAVVRRVLTPAQFGGNAATLAAQSELAGLVSMKVSADEGRTSAPASASSAPAAPLVPLKVAGYRVLAFYP